MKQARTIARDVIGERLLAALEVRGLRVVHADTKAGKIASQVEAAVEPWRAIVERVAAYPCATGSGDGVYEGLHGPSTPCGCAPCDARALLAREVGS